MATLTNVNVGAQETGAGAGASAMPRTNSADAVSGGMDDLAAQFNQRRYRPMAVSDLFDEAFELYRSNFMLFVATAALILVPLNAVIYEFVTPNLRGATQHLAQSQLDPSQIIDFLGEATSTTLTILVVYSLFFVLLSGASIAIASNRYLGRPAELIGAYKTASKRTLPLLLCVILAFLATAAATAFCVIPGIYVFLRFALLPQVVLLEPTLNPFKALGRTWRMSSAHIGRIFGIVLLLSVISGVVTASLQGPIQIALSVLPLDSLPVLSDIARHRDISLDIASVTANLLTTPFTFITLTALYYDLRIRDEGYDMAVLSGLLGFGDLKRWLTGAIPPAAAPARVLNRTPLPRAMKAAGGKRFWGRKRGVGE